MLELAKTSPAVLAAFLADLERFQNQLTDIVARRQAMRPDNEMTALISALALTAIRSGIERWASGEPQGCRRHTDALRRARCCAGQQHFHEVI